MQGSSFEGNVHLGYRRLFSESGQLIGIYGSFDRRRSPYRNYFNQVMVGGEYWRNRWFLGGNFYHPLGRKKRSIKREKRETKRETRNAILFESMIQEYHEKSLPWCRLRSRLCFD